MASDDGPVATEAHLDAPILPPSSALATAVGATAAFVNEAARAKSLKRGRDTTPVADESVNTADDLSPSKIARLVGFARQSPAPLTGAAALEDERRRKEEELRLNPPGTTENVNHRVLHDLMSGAVAMSRQQDAQLPAGPAVLADATVREPIVGPIPTADIQAIDGKAESEGEPSPTGLGSAGGQVVHSPTAMEVDSRTASALYAPQPEAQMEERAPNSLSYPGPLAPAGVVGAAQGPPRGMSLPNSSSQNPESTPRSPSNKKHKCPYCETVFTRHHNLKSHLLTHSQEKPYVCQNCQMRFRRLHDLKRHSKLHTGEKPHICPKCDRKFARGDALARHSKGAGGCAGRRSSMGGFGTGDEDYEGASTVEGDDSAMAGVMYDGSPDGEMTDEERRRLSLPSIKAQHHQGQALPDGYATHSSTYPPTGPRPAGGLFPPNIDRSSSSATSPSLPNSHTPHTSISSVPLSAGSSSLFSQSGVTESPKPLSPAAQHNQMGNVLGRLRSPNANAQQHAAPAAHGMSTAAQQAWLSQYPPADRSPTKGNAAVPVGQQAAVARVGAAGVDGVDNSNNLFASQDGMLALVHQQLEPQFQRMVHELEEIKKERAADLIKMEAQEQAVQELRGIIATQAQQLQELTSGLSSLLRAQAAHQVPGAEVELAVAPVP